MRRVAMFVLALAGAFALDVPTSATAPPTTTPAATTTALPGTATTTSITLATSTTLGPNTLPVVDDEDDWTIRRLVFTGAAVIAGLAFVGWAVAKVRNELAKPSAPKR